MAIGSVNVPGASYAEMKLLELSINTLVGSDTGKSAREIALEELVAQLIREDAQESMNELKEIAAWIQDHPEDAAAMNAAITELRNLIDTGDETVSAYIKTALAGKQAQHKEVTVTLAAGATEWTVAAAGVTANNLVFVNPSAGSEEAYLAAGARCTEQAANSLTFTAASAPEVDLAVNVAIFD